MKFSPAALCSWRLYCLDCYAEDDTDDGGKINKKVINYKSRNRPFSLLFSTHTQASFNTHLLGSPVETVECRNSLPKESKSRIKRISGRNYDVRWEDENTGGTMSVHDEGLK